MRLNIASAVEGCLYSRLKTVPGSFSRYSKDLREETDISARDVEVLFDATNVICQSSCGCANNSEVSLK